MTTRIVLFLSTRGLDPRAEPLTIANDDWDPDCPATAAHVLRLAWAADRISERRDHAHG